MIGDTGVGVVGGTGVEAGAMTRVAGAEVVESTGAGAGAEVEVVVTIIVGDDPPTSEAW